MHSDNNKGATKTTEISTSQSKEPKSTKAIPKGVRMTMWCKTNTRCQRMYGMYETTSEWYNLTTK